MSAGIAVRRDAAPGTRPRLASAVRAEFRLLWRGFVLPVCIIVCALFGVANVTNQIGALHSDIALVNDTKAEYAANGMDFSADLAKPARVVTKGDEQTVSNLARYDYDTVAGAIVALSPASSVEQVFQYFGFVFFPVVFFLLGLWMSTVQRRYHREKVTLARLGTVAAVAARQFALLGAAAVIVAVTLVVDAVSRSVATAFLSAELPLRAYPPLAPTPHSNVFAEWGLMLLVLAFFGGGGIAVGAATGVFAVPALVFLTWDLVVPFLGPGDPRNWFVVLGHSIFRFTNGFQLAAEIALPIPAAALFAVSGSAVLVALGYVCIRIRNPLAT